MCIAIVCFSLDDTMPFVLAVLGVVHKLYNVPRTGWELRNCYMHYIKVVIAFANARFAAPYYIVTPSSVLSK